MHTDVITTEYVRCDLCGSDDQVLLYSQVDPITHREYHLVECRCGMAFVNPAPVDECTGLLYPADYMKGKHLWDSRYDRMVKMLPHRPGGRLLDVGCGQGNFLLRASQDGWNVGGVDLLSWEPLHGVPIRVEDFPSADLPENSYDAITAWAVLEHVPRPSSFFEKVSRLLKPDGQFIFLVPNFKAPGMKRSCTQDIPRHLWLFSPKAVRSYLAKFGMEPVNIFYHSAIYTAYPFGLLRYGVYRLWGKTHRCERYQNRSVALLRGRQVKGNLGEWLSEVVRSVGIVDLMLDAADLALGVCVGKLSELLGTYGVMTVVAARTRQAKRS